MTILPASTLRSVHPFSISCRAFGFLLGLGVTLVSGCASSPPATPVPQTAPATAGPAPAAQAEGPVLRSGIAVDRDLPLDGRDEISLDLKAADYVRLSFDAGNLNLDARLLGPGGETVSRAEGSNGYLSAITRSGGRYRLAMNPSSPKTGGRYRVTLEELRKSKEGDADRVDADTDLSEANRLGSQGRYDKGIGKAQEALDLCRKIQDRGCEFEALYEIGSSYLSTGGWDQARAAYQKALEVAGAAANRRDQARAYTALGAVLTRTETVIDAESARPYLEQALRFWQESGDSYRQSRVLYDLAIGRYSMGRFDEAIDSYRKALALTDPAGSLASNIWNGLGNVYASLGESLKALECFVTALRIAEETKNRGAEAAALTSAGNIYQRRGEPQKAILNFKKALEINQSDPELKKYEAKVLLQIGSVDLDLGQADEALAEYQKALDAARRDGNEGGIANALWGIGRVDLVKDRPQDALEPIGRALDIATQKQIIGIQAAVLHEIGVARLKLHQLPEAVKSLEDALPLRKKTNRLGEALTRQALGKTYLEQGDLAQADSFLHDALTIADEVGASLTGSSIHYDLARLRRRQDQLPEALSEIEQAITILEAVRSDISQDRLRTSFFASRRPYYDFWVDLLMELERRNPGQGYKDKALAASDKGRARALLDLLSQGRLELTRGIDPGLRKREAEVKARLTQIQQALIDERSDRKKERTLFIETLEARLQEADREQREIEAEIKARYPLYYQLQYPSPLQRNDIQRLLPSKDSALLEYSLGEHGSYLFVVTTEGLTVHPLTLSQQEISGEFGRIGAGFKPGGQLPFSYKQAAYRLYETLIAPAKDEIAGKRHLLIAPDGILNYLPFDTLLTRQAQGEKSLAYLLYDFSISYIPSASVLASLSVQRPSVTTGSETTMRFLAFAPDYGTAASQESGRGAIPERGQLPDLEGARQEVQEIAKRYRPGETKVYLGPEASRKNFESPLIADRIHFAGHGLPDEEHPENSALILSDGPLRVSDIFNLDLKADLVVLSACKTAGKQVTGEGLVGLTRAFLYAGSPSVVVTLWQVVDSPTSDLMRGFYEHLDRTGDKAEALRQAKIGMIQRKGRLALPYYWAPFVLIGKAR